MKIFANNFALSLDLEPEQSHFRVERHRLAEIREALLHRTPLFEGETWYLTAGTEPDLLPGLLHLQRHPQVGLQRAWLRVLFATAAERQAFWEAYAAAHKPVAAAGGLVLNDSEELLLIFRYGKWDLPKGKVEEGEDLPTAAWREVAEETGLTDHQIGPQMAETFHIWEQKGAWRLKTTYWYQMSHQGHGRPAPQVEEAITRVDWKPLAELRQEIPDTYPQIQDLIRQASLIGQASAGTS